MRGSRSNGTNPRALGLSPRQLASHVPKGRAHKYKKPLVTGVERRNGVPRWLRFEVLKRDGFRCVYCGAGPKQAMLHADHVLPKAKGGETVAANLVCACEDCNGGKADRLLTEGLL